MSKEQKGITIKHYDIAKPDQVQNMALVLKDYIKKNGLSVSIQGKQYCQVEGWQFAGFLTGIMPVIDSVENLSTQNEIKWKSVAKLMKDGQQVGIGIAVCSNKEGKKRAFDEYAILSMAQTRSIGKAYRNMLGWVVKMAGYETTPAEEMRTEQPNQDNRRTPYEIAVSMIENAKTESRLMQIQERVEKTDKLSSDQKKELDKMVSNKIDLITSENEKKSKK